MDEFRVDNNMNQIGLGTFSQRVRIVQDGVNRAMGRNMAVNSDFGSLTQGHVRDFQASRGLVNNGWAGTNTWARMASEFGWFTGIVLDFVRPGGW